MWKLLHQMHLITHVGRRQFLYGLLCVSALCHPTVSLASEQPHVIFRAPEHLRPVVTRLESMGWPSYRYALELAGLKHPGPAIHVHLVPEHSETVRHVPGWVSGYAHGPSSSIILFPQRVRSYPARAIEDLLVHEVAHIFNSRAAKGRAIPRWFDEGIATVAARTWDLEDRARLLWAVGARDGFSLDRLNRLFDGNAPTARRGYSLAAGFIRDIIQEHGADAPGRILERVARDVPFSVAFRQIVALSPDEAAAAFLTRQSRWIRWVPFVTSDAILWIGVAVLACVAFGVHVRRVRARRRKRAEEEEDDDAWFDDNVPEQPTDLEWDDRWRDR